MWKVPNFSISLEKVFFIVAKLRQSDGKATESDWLPNRATIGLKITPRTLIALSFPASFEA